MGVFRELFHRSSAVKIQLVGLALVADGQAAGTEVGMGPGAVHQGIFVQLDGLVIDAGRNLVPGC